jgi:hypothetical protein
MSQNGLEDEMMDLDEELEDSTEDELYTELTDDRREELDEMLGLRVLGVEIWEESLGDDENAPPKAAERVFFDCDLFLESNQALELYVTAVYPDPDGGEPVTGLSAIHDAVGALADGEMELVDFDKVDEEGGLALAFGHADHVDLVLAASAWMVSEWEADEEAEEEA